MAGVLQNLLNRFSVLADKKVWGPLICSFACLNFFQQSLTHIKSRYVNVAHSTTSSLFELFVVSITQENVYTRDVSIYQYQHLEPILILSIPPILFYLLSINNKSFCKQYQRMYLVNLAFYCILNIFLSENFP